MNNDNSSKIERDNHGTMRREMLISIFVFSLLSSAGCSEFDKLKSVFEERKRSSLLKDNYKDFLDELEKSAGHKHWGHVSGWHDRVNVLYIDCLYHYFICRESRLSKGVCQERLDHCGHTNIEEDLSNDTNVTPEVDRKAKSCDSYKPGQNGVYTIWVDGRAKSVWCSWGQGDRPRTTVMKRGQYGNAKDYFNKGWTEYKNGFGDSSREFWIGLDTLHRMTQDGDFDIYISMKDIQGQEVEVIAQKVKIQSETEGYGIFYEKVFANDYPGISGRSLALSFPQRGLKFSTKDRDNDLVKNRHCAKDRRGGWWFSYCEGANLNGLNLNGPSQGGIGINWPGFKGLGYSLSEVSFSFANHDPTLKPQVSVSPDEEKTLVSREKSSQVPASSYIEEFVCKEQTMSLDCGGLGKILIQTSSFDNSRPSICPSKDLPRPSSTKACKKNLSFNLKKLCEGKNSCIIRRLSSKSSLVGLNKCDDSASFLYVAYTCSGLESPKITGSEAASSRHSLVHAIDNQVSTGKVSFYSSKKMDQPWILLDMREKMVVKKIVIQLPRGCCPANFKNLDVRVGNVKINEGFKGLISENERCAFVKNEPTDPKVAQVIPCEKSGLAGRYVTLQLTAGQTFLQINELKIIAAIPQRGGWKPHYRASGDIIKNIKDVGTADKCRIICGLVNSCFAFAYNIDDSSCVLLSRTPRLQFVRQDSFMSGLIESEGAHGASVNPDNIYKSRILSGQPFLMMESVQTYETCYQLCASIEKCVTFAWNRITKRCDLKEYLKKLVNHDNFISGSMRSLKTYPDCSIKNAQAIGNMLDEVYDVGYLGHCQKLCKTQAGCTYWTLLSEGQVCQRFRTISGLKLNSGAISGGAHCDSKIIKSVFFGGGSVISKSTQKKTAEDCQKLCESNPECLVWSYSFDKKYCDLRRSFDAVILITSIVSGFSKDEFVVADADFVEEDHFNMRDIKYSEKNKLMSMKAMVHPGMCRSECDRHPKCFYWTHDMIGSKCVLMGQEAKNSHEFATGFTSGNKLSQNDCFEHGLSYYTKVLKAVEDVESPELCQELCRLHDDCQGFSFIVRSRLCHLKDGGKKVKSAGVVSGPKECPKLQRAPFVQLYDCFDHEYDYHHLDVMYLKNVLTPFECQLECQKNPSCTHWTLSAACYLKSGKSGLKRISKGVTSGPKYCNECFKTETYIEGKTLKTINNAANAGACQNLCRSNSACKLFSYDTKSKKCHLKKDGIMKYGAEHISGPRDNNCKKKVHHQPLKSFDETPKPNCYLEAYDLYTSGVVLKTITTLDKATACQTMCFLTEGCTYFVFNEEIKHCILKSSTIYGGKGGNRRNVSGPKICTDCFEHGFGRKGSELSKKNAVFSPLNCQKICYETNLCESWTLRKADRVCTLFKNSILYASASHVSGMKTCNNILKPNLVFDDPVERSSCFYSHMELAGSTSQKINNVFSSQECQKLCQKYDEVCLFWSWDYVSKDCYMKSENNPSNLKSRNNFISGPPYCRDCFRRGVEFVGNSVKTVKNIKSPEACQSLCIFANCDFWTLNKGNCVQKQGQIKMTKILTTAVSGFKNCDFSMLLDNKYSHQRPCMDSGIRRIGKEIKSVNSVRSSSVCKQMCYKEIRCMYWNWNKRRAYCQLVSDLTGLDFFASDFISGKRKCKENCFAYDIIYLASLIDTVKFVFSPESCQYLCQQHSKCTYWVFLVEENSCERKNNKKKLSNKAFVNGRYVSGPKHCPSNRAVNYEADCTCPDFRYNFDQTVRSSSPSDCHFKCSNQPTCEHWSFGKDKCHIQSIGKPNSLTSSKGYVSSRATCDDCFIHKMGHKSKTLRTYVNVKSAKDCQRLCQSDSKCNHFSYNVFKSCFIKGVAGFYIQPLDISGPKYCNFLPAGLKGSPPKSLSFRNLGSISGDEFYSDNDFPADSCFRYDISFQPNTLEYLNSVRTTQECQEKCKTDIRCFQFTFHPGTEICMLKESGNNLTLYEPGFVSGPKFCESLWDYHNSSSPLISHNSYNYSQISIQDEYSFDSEAYNRTNVRSDFYDYDKDYDIEYQFKNYEAISSEEEERDQTTTPYKTTLSTSTTTANVYNYETDIPLTEQVSSFENTEDNSDIQSYFDSLETAENNEYRFERDYLY